MDMWNRINLSIQQNLLAAFLLLLLVISSGSLKAASPQLVTILENLDKPTDLALVTSSDDSRPYQLVIAESRRGRLLLSSPSGETNLLADDLEPGPISMQPAADDSLIVSSSKMIVLGSKPKSEILINYKSFGAEPPTASLQINGMAISERYLFAIYSDQLLRAQRNDIRFTALRSFAFDQEANVESQLTALCFSEKGHLVVACSAEAQATLAFCNPHEPAPASRIRVEGISRIDSLAYGYKPRPAERRLYALVTDAASEEQLTGLYRLDAMPLVSGEISCQAKLVVPIARPVAFTMAPDGTAYFLALTDDGQGVLLHSGDQY